MATPSPKKPSHAGKILLVLFFVLVVGLAGYGYFSQSSELRSASDAAQPPVQAEAKAEPLDARDPLFAAKPGDIVIGDANAPVTILDYSSLSCPHCAHFHNEVFPVVKKQLLDTGKAKLVFRHFPLNEPALRAAQLVQCAAPDKRVNFIKVLFAMQKDWAFTESFKDDLRKIAGQGGIDSAAFDSCLADKEGENEVLGQRQEAATRAHVNSTPSFFVNGVLMESFINPADFTKAVDAAQKPASR